MTELDREINDTIMREIGLEPNKKNQICDQDTRVVLKINNQDVIKSGCYGGRNTVEFDPHNNRKMMTDLFGYFLNKYEEETGSSVLSYYNIDNKRGNKVELKLNDETTITSHSYKRDSLKYTDIIMQLNGESKENIDLSKYDVEVPKGGIKRK